MSKSLPLPEWQSVTASSMAEVLAEDNWLEIKDVVALTGDRTPEWLQQLAIPHGWLLLTLPGNLASQLARVAVYGPRDDGGWEASEIVCVFGYTGWPVFFDMLNKPTRTLRALGARDIVTKVLPVPPMQWTGAVRTSGIALIGGKPVWERDGNSVWVQQTSYVAGSEKPHAGRLIVHSLFVDGACRARLGGDIAELSDAIYHGFVAAVSTERSAG